MPSASGQAAAGYTSGKITLFDPATGKPRAAWQAHRGNNLHALAFSPDGRFLASTGADGTAKVWDVDTKKLRAVLLGHRGNPYGVAFSPDGQTVATGGTDSLVLLWDVSALHAGPAP